MGIIKAPFQVPFLITIVNNRVIRLDNRHRISNPITFLPLEIHKYHTKSKDQVQVPYVVIKQKGSNPKAQLVYVYGAYGSITPIDWPYRSWYPLLKRGWAVVFALVRGGGDANAAWADAARRDHRHIAVDDFEAVIRVSQQKYHLGPDKTVIYGRSAGGVPVGAMVSRFPDGQLMGAAFTEVPYVDVLRTSSNPSLPLTKGEYQEFGNPRDNILNFKELLSVSPVNTLPAEGAPGVFVMSHVGLLDRQVYAYESFKWIHKLRGEHVTKPNGKYVTFERQEAHQYRPKRMPHFRGVDLAILEAWVEGELRLE
jgi:oligopeptidase B